MLNGYPLGSQPLGSLPAAGTAPDPVPVPALAGTVAWRAQVLLGGADVTAAITGRIEIDRPPEGDTTCTFVLHVGDDPVQPALLAGAPVVVNLLLGDDVHRRFTGALEQPVLDPLARTLACTATTRLSDRVEAMEYADIDLLVGGVWSVDVFEEREGRQRWEYAQERLQTRAASLVSDRWGQPLMAPWHAPAAYTFGAGTTLYESLDIGLPSVSELVTRIELDVDYRYTRARQRLVNFSWTHPDGRGESGFQQWRDDATELPDVDMVTQAVEAGGWYLSSAQWFRLPLTRPAEQWFNEFPDLLLGVDLTAGLRWSQRCVEQYRLTLVPSTSMPEADPPVIARERVVLDTDTESSWDGSRPPTPAPLQRNSVRLAAAMDCALRRARVQMLASWRSAIVTWQVPLPAALALERGQGVHLQDQGADVIGTVSSLAEVLDLETGEALLTISAAVTIGGIAGDISDPLTPPPVPSFAEELAPTVPATLPTQIGLRLSSPVYDPDQPGFAGNYSFGDAPPDQRFPRRFAVDFPEIPDSHRNEAAGTSARTYRVALPVERLEV